MQAQQKGFTLIELIVVIVILGILSATALPKFIDLGVDARKAVIQSVEGSMRSANMMIYAKAASLGKLNATQLLQSEVPGATGNINLTNGYATDATDLAKVMDVDAAKINVTTAAGAFYTGYAVGTCGVTYTKSAAASTPPTYATVVTGC